MSFYDLFQNSFSPEERQSEIVRVLSMVGVNAEKAILEHLSVELRSVTELMAFPEQRLRSWLAFFLRPVRNVVSSRGRVLAEVENDGEHSEAVYVPAGAVLQGKNGKLFYQEEQETFFPGVKKWVKVVQGKLVMATGTYSEFIAIPAVGVDISEIRVELGGEEIAQADSDSAEMYFGVCDSLSDAVVKEAQIPGFILSSGAVVRVKFSFTNSAVGMELDISGSGPAPVLYQGEPVLPSFFVAGGVYEFTFDSGRWVVSGQSVSAVEVVNGSVKPYDGFYAFYYNNTLYIKIFRGPHVIVSSQYRVTYRVSDGVAGNLGVNQFKGYQDSFSYSDGASVSIRVENEEPISGGVDAPLFYELVAELRRKFFVTTNVASVPEYRTWFLSRPEVFDCLVESDLVRSVVSGQTEVSGKVVVYLMGVSSSASGVRTFEPLIPVAGSDLRRELEKVRDLAPLDFKGYVSVYNFYHVWFQSSDDNKRFVVDAEATVNRFYSDVGLLRALNLSLFEDFDVTYLYRGLAGLYNVTGLNVVPYHFREYLRDDFQADDDWVVRPYSGEDLGKGYYEFWGPPADNPEGAFVCLRTFRELLTVEGEVGVYWEDSLADAHYSAGERRFNGDMVLYLEQIPADALRVRCFWPIADRGIMPVGVVHGARMLAGVKVDSYR
jgi:hypothetical protein